jgi:tripartite-type tricarboxylate transporter receptor subunit TctC
MKISRRRFLHLAAGAAALPAVSRVARAQAYPTRPITMIVGAAAGGPTDTIGRIIVERMRASLGQTIIIENNGSAAGSIAHGRVARAAPDGYMLSLGHLGTHVYNGAVYSLPYDVLADFEPVSLISNNPFLFAARNGFPANDLKGLLDWLKANPNKGLLGTAGAGSPPHIGGVFLQSITGSNWQYVPYRGALPAMQGLMGGEVDWTLTTPDTGLPQLRGGAHQSLGRNRPDPSRNSARYSDGGRGGIARILPFILAWAVGTQRHAEGGGRQAQLRAGRLLGKSCGA